MNHYRGPHPGRKPEQPSVAGNGTGSLPTLQNVERLIEAGQREQALEQLNELIKGEQAGEKVYFTRAEVNRLLGHYHDAIKDYNRVIELNPLNVNAFIWRGELYRLLKQPHKALNDLNRALELAPDSTQAYGRRGTVYRNLKEYQNALDDYNRAIELAPPNPWLHGNRAEAYGGLKQYRQAIEDYSRVLQLDPRQDWVYERRAYPYLWLNNLEAAWSDFSYSWKLNPDNLKSAWMAEWTEMCKEVHSPLTEVARWLEHLAERAPEQPAAYLCRGALHWIRGNYEESLEELETATALDSSAGGGYFWKGMAYASLGQNEPARRNFETAVEMGLPPALFQPVRWLHAQNREFYNRYGASLLRAAPPSKLSGQEVTGQPATPVNLPRAFDPAKTQPLPIINLAPQVSPAGSEPEDITRPFAFQLPGASAGTPPLHENPPRLPLDDRREAEAAGQNVTSPELQSTSTRPFKLKSLLEAAPSTPPVAPESNRSATPPEIVSLTAPANAVEPLPAATPPAPPEPAPVEVVAPAAVSGRNYSPEAGAVPAPVDSRDQKEAKSRPWWLYPLAAAFVLTGLLALLFVLLAGQQDIRPGGNVPVAANPTADPAQAATQPGEAVAGVVTMQATRTPVATAPALTAAAGAGSGQTTAASTATVATAVRTAPAATPGESTTGIAATATAAATVQPQPSATPAPTAPTPARTASLSGHSGPISEVAWSNDGRYFVTASEDKTLKVWDAGTNQVVRTLDDKVRPNKDKVLAARWSSDNQYIVAASADKFIRIYSVFPKDAANRFNSGTVLIEATDGVVPQAAAIAPDNSLVPYPGPDVLHTWNMVKDDSGPDFPLNAGGATVSALAFSRDGKYLAIGLSDGRTQVWDVAAVKLRLTVPAAEAGEAISGLTWATGDRQLAVIGKKSLRLVPLRISGENLAAEPAGLDLRTQVTSWAYSPDGKRLAGGGPAGEVEIWSLESNKSIRRFNAGAGPVVGLRWNPAGQELTVATGGNRPQLAVYTAGSS